MQRLSKNTNTNNPPLLHIRNFCPAANNSVVLLLTSSSNSNTILRHYNSSGTLTYKYKFGCRVTTLSMPNDRHVVVLVPQNRTILVFNLANLTQGPITFYHDYSIHDDSMVFLHYFCETQLLAIQ